MKIQKTLLLENVTTSSNPTMIDLVKEATAVMAQVSQAGVVYGDFVLT